MKKPTDYSELPSWVVNEELSVQDVKQLICKDKSKIMDLLFVRVNDENVN